MSYKEMIKLADKINTKYADEPNYTVVESLPPALENEPEFEYRETSEIPETPNDSFHYSLLSDLKGLISDLHKDKGELSIRIPNKQLNVFFETLIKDLTSIGIELDKNKREKKSPYPIARKFVDFIYKKIGSIDRINNVLKNHLKQTNQQWFSGSQEDDKLKYWTVTSLDNLLNEVDKIDREITRNYSSNLGG